MTTRPVIATVTLDQRALACLQRWRNRYYPQARTPAHVTLFRHLPGTDPDATTNRVAMICATRTAFDMTVTAPYLLGNGVALAIHSDELIVLRQRIAEEFGDELRPDDRKPFVPHVTIQNRVTRRRAQRTFGAVRAKFEPLTARVLGVSLWFYEGGGWAALAEIPFDD